MNITYMSGETTAKLGFPNCVKLLISLTCLNSTGNKPWLFTISWQQIVRNNDVFTFADNPSDDNPNRAYIMER